MDLPGMNYRSYALTGADPQLAPMIAQMTLTAWLLHMSIQDSDGRIHNPNAG